MYLFRIPQAILYTKTNTARFKVQGLTKAFKETSVFLSSATCLFDK